MAQYIVEHSFLFTQEERTTIYESVSEVKTKPVSLVTRLFYPLWSLMSIYLLNEHIAPNAITLCGVLCSLQSYQLISTYYGSRWSTSIPAILRLESVAAAVMSEGKPASVGEATTISAKADFFHVDRRVQSATVLATVLLLIAVMCGSLDGVHARRCRSYSVLGDIFSRVCTSISRVFMALTMLEVMHIEDISTRWYVVLALQLVEFNTMLGRINAANIKKDKVKNWAYVITYCFRDAELTFAILMILVARWSFPSVVYDVGVWLNPSTARIGYWALVMISFLNIALLKMRKRRKGSIAISLAARVVPFFAVLPLGEYNMLSVVGDAMVVGLLTAEVYISFLAHRRIHAAVVILCVSSLLNDVLAVVATCLYITGVLVDLSYSLNLPLFVPVRNVFIDGVFDLCHAGHKILMKNALSFGNRLVVGVCGDEECADYKRRPIMTLEERVNEVRLCKYVSEVIPNSPVTGITLNMINKHNIHLVVCGEEYNTEKDTYYAVPRKLGILRTAPRTEGISTSVLIARIRRASDDDVVARDKASGNSNVKDGS